ncbi:heme ABC transporter substrate-binding protein IsdE [Berryella wangjianweii]|nr:heme ABC transporter substrate-binding protein IsdE [Berryella wangjianweii]
MPRLSRMRRAWLAAACALLAALLLGGCVNQHPDRDASGDGGAAQRIVVTSPAVAEMTDRLGLDVVGVPKTAFDLPARYADATVVGPPMAPDLEVLATLHPDYIVSPISLSNDLRPKYASIGRASIFANLNSVDGLYESVSYLGAKFDRQQQADQLVAQYRRYMDDFRARIADKPRPRVLVLMGVPGSYLVATPHSYVGSLVEQAGGQNVYDDAPDAFVNANTEDMLARDPDIILRCAHALPDQIRDMFAKEFSTNDIWRHFRAVQEGRVHDLPHDQFGMSATFRYPEAHTTLLGLLYGMDEGAAASVPGATPHAPDAGDSGSAAGRPPATTGDSSPSDAASADAPVASRPSPTDAAAVTASHRSSSALQGPSEKKGLS